jgi:hypothetical protein
MRLHRISAILFASALVSACDASTSRTFHVNRSADVLTRAVASLGHDTEMGAIASYMDSAHLRIEHPDAQTVRIVLPGEKAEQDVSFDFVVTPGPDAQHADLKMIDHIPDDTGMKGSSGEALKAKGIRETMWVEANALVRKLGAGADPVEAAGSMRMGLHVFQVSHRQSTRDEEAQYKDPAFIHQAAEKAGMDSIDSNPNIPPEQREKIKEMMRNIQAKADASQAARAGGQSPSQ